MSESGSPNGSTETWLVDDRVVLLDQISVFLENRPGSLAAAAAALADAGTNLRALSIAETERFGIARLIADDTEQALATLQQAGFTSRVSKVFGIQVPDRPGGLAHLLQIECFGSPFTSTWLRIDWDPSRLDAPDGPFRVNAHNV